MTEQLRKFESKLSYYIFRDKVYYYAFGSNQFEIGLSALFETLDKGYLEVVPGQMLGFMSDDWEDKNSIIPGKNVITNKKENKYYSKIDGMVAWDKNKVNVLPFTTIETSASKEKGTGIIKFDGTVLVFGTIDNDTEIEVSGNIYAFKILDAKVKAGGDIFIREGIENLNKGFLECRNLKTKYITNSKNIHTQNLLIVEEQIIDSEIKSGNSVFMTGDEAIINRSVIYARQQVKCKQIGSKSQKIIKINIGIEEKEKMELINKKLEVLQNQEKIDEYNKEIEDYKKFQDSERNRTKIKWYSQQVTLLEDTSSTIEHSINKTRKNLEYDKVNEYLKFNKDKVKLDEKEEEILQQYKKYAEHFNIAIKKIDKKAEELEAGMMDDKTLEKLEQLDIQKTNIQKNIDELSSFYNLLYVPVNASKVIYEYEGSTFYLGLTPDEKKGYDELSERMSFCKKNIEKFTADKNDLLKENKEQNKNKIEKLDKNLNDIKKTLRDLENKVKYYSKILNEREFCGVGTSVNLFANSVLYHDGIKTKIEKPYDSIYFSLNNDKVLMEGFMPPILKKYLFKINRYNDKPNLEKIEQLKMRGSLVIEGIENKTLHKRGMQVIGVKPQNIMFVDLDNYHYNSKKILIVNVIMVSPKENKETLRQNLFKIKKNYPIQVVGANVNECLEKASKHFGVAASELSYDTIQIPRKHFISSGKQSYILRVYKAEQEKRNADGFFVLLNTPKGLTLTVFAPKGKGGRVKAKEVVKQLKDFRYVKEINIPEIKKAIHNSDAEEYTIGPRQPEPEIDGRFFIQITEDKMQAIVKLLPPKPGGIVPPLKEIKKELEKYKFKAIRYSDLEKAIDRVVKNDEKIQIAVAKGNPPIKGQDGYIIYPFLQENSQDDTKSKKSKNEEIESIDFHSVKPLDNVQKDDIIAIRVPPKDGKPGEDIYGNKIKPRPGAKAFLKSGRNTYNSDDGTNILSRTDGVAFIENNEISVKEALNINGDVDYNTGNIDFVGTVVISGIIKDGFVVKAGGDIFVTNIEGASVESGGNLYVRRGITGNKKALIRVGGNLITNFIEQATVEVKRNILVTTGIMHSDVSARKYIVVLSAGRGLIVGGQIRAGLSIFAKMLGSDKAGTITEVMAGTNPNISKNLKRLEKLIIDFNKAYKMNRLNIKKLNREKKSSDTGELSQKRAMMLKKFRKKDKELVSKLKHILEKRDKLNKHLEEGKKGTICIKEVCYTGVRISIAKAKLKVNKPTDFVTFFYLNDQIRIKPYEEPKTELFKEFKSAQIKLREV